MDVEFKPPHQENGTSKKEGNDDLKEKLSPDAETNGTSKDSPKHSSRPKRGHRRSRSRTPQQKSDDTKTLHVSLKKMNAELNGKDLKEEPEKPEGKDVEEENQAVSDKDLEPISTKSGTKENEDVAKNEKQTKKPTADNKQEEDEKRDATQEKENPVEEEVSSKKATPRKEKKDKMKKQESSHGKSDVDSETVEMDPLIISDEPDPELLFDENSDIESGMGSPIISRCVTRRSQTRNIPTPKTPKSIDPELELEKNPVTDTPTEIPVNEVDCSKTDQENNTQDTSDMANLSTMVVIGSDVTRMNYLDTNDSNVVEDTSYINASRERSLGETLRSLSARRPIRPLEDYRRRALRINQERSELNTPYNSATDSVATGMKRKNRSITPEDRKKFKSDSPGLNSLFVSPLASLRNKFRSDLPSSTPKLLGYRDGTSELHYNDEQNMEHAGDDEKKTWCTVM